MFDTSIHNTFVRRTVIIVFAFLLIVVSHAALAVSFDCAKALYETERAICQSPLLRDLDDTLAEAYRRARVSSSEASTLKDQQVEWVRSSRRCGSDVACLEAAYRFRIAQLGGAPIQPSPAATPPISRATPAIAAGTATAPGQRPPTQSATVDGVVDEEVVAEAEKERSAADSAKRWEQWEEASKEKFAMQVLKARQAAETEAKKERELAAEAERSAAKRWDQFTSWSIVVAVVVGIGFVVYLIAGASSACPKCGKWFSTQTLATYELGRRGAYETITRQDQHKNAKGELIGTTSRQEQVHVTYINYRDQKQCSKCAHQWVAEYTTKV